MRSPGMRPRWLWVTAVLAPLVVGRSSTTAMLAAAAALAVLVLVLVVAVVALDSAFARSAERGAPACTRSRRCCGWPRGRSGGYGGLTDNGGLMTGRRQAQRGPLDACCPMRAQVTA